MTNAWTTGPWTVEEDRWAKKLAFGPRLGWLDNDDIEVSPEEHVANKLVLELAPLMAEAILYVTDAETRDEAGYRVETLDKFAARLRGLKMSEDD